MVVKQKKSGKKKVQKFECLENEKSLFGKLKSMKNIGNKL